MSRDKKIEEMAKIAQDAIDNYCSVDCPYFPCRYRGSSICCDVCSVIEALYNADYRRQSEVIAEFIKNFENAFSELQEFYSEDTYENLVASNDVLNLLDKIEKQMKGGAE